MIQATKPTFSFGILLLIAIGLVGAVFYLSREMANRNLQLLPVVPQHKKLANKTPTNTPVKAFDMSELVSTTGWQEYTDQDHAISFKYPETWQVETYTRDGFDIIVLKPDQGQDNIRIYVSPNEYIGIAGLQTSSVIVGGKKGVSANNMVIGVKQGKTFFTFDAGQDQTLIPKFNGIIKTVAFNK